MRSLSLTVARRTVALGLGLLVVLLVGFAGAIQVATWDGYSPFVIRGGSMEPAIPLGSLVLVRPIDPASVGVGDVLTIRTDGGQVFTHRVVALVESGGERSFQTRGDANAKPDPQAVPGRAIVGVVAVEIPVAGFLMALLQLRSGIVCIASLLAALLLLYWLLEDLEPRTRVPARGAGERASHPAAP